MVHVSSETMRGTITEYRWATRITSPPSSLSPSFRRHGKAREKQYMSRLPADEKARVQALGGTSIRTGAVQFLGRSPRRNQEGGRAAAALAYIENFNWTYGKWLRRKNCVIKSTISFLSTAASTSNFRAGS